MDLQTAQEAAGIVAGLNAINAMSAPLATLITDQAIVLRMTAVDPQQSSNTELDFTALAFTAPESAQIVASVQSILNARFTALNTQLAGLPVKA